MKRLLCILREIWNSSRVSISGHDFVLEHEGLHEVQVLKCKTCDHYSVSWQ